VDEESIELTFRPVATTSRRKKRTAPDPAKRRTEIADAALAVLGTEGSRGLTHRAVDEAAGRPPGSTSNYFRTREALLEAAARRHLELDMPPAELLEALTEDKTPLSREQLQALILAALEPVLAESTRGRLIARYELTLESTRRPELHEVMDELRRTVAELIAIALRRSDCKDPELHARHLVAVLDGIAVDQVSGTSPTLDRAATEQLIDRFLDTC
jgi:DNA-binding transcriptional regulator YbjK